MIVGVCLVIWGALGLVVVLSKQEQGDLLQRMSSFLYKFCCVHKLPIVERRQVSVDLGRLNPGRSERELQMDYYVEKLRLVLLVLLVGSLLTGLLGMKEMLEGALGTEPSLRRGEVGEGEWEAHLMAQIGEKKEEVYVNVLERQLTEEELQVLYASCLAELEALIRAAEDEKGQITEDISLPEALEGYPFEISWKSSEPMLIHQDGSLEAAQLTGGEQVRLTASLWYGEKSREQEFLIELGATTVENTLKRSLQEALWEKEEASRYEESFPLPDRVGEEHVTWTLLQESNSPIFLILTLVAAVGVFVLKDKDLHEQTLERRKSLKISYPMILNKFVLYMGAGMTVRGCFLKIAMDYRKNSKERLPAYEEMLYSCHELSAGVSEGLVYERFGKRSGLQEYARFAAMLGQNLKKGNSALLGRLREESDKAMLEDLQFRKKIGEEAETKLLVPMIMMLGIVMLLVMIPAFTAFE